MCDFKSKNNIFVQNARFLLKNAIFVMSASHIFQKCAITSSSYTKTIAVPKRVVLTSNEKNKIFPKKNFLKKIKGGGESKTHKISHIFSLTEISGRFFGRIFQKLAGWKFYTQLTPIFCGFQFEAIEKKLGQFKVRLWPIFKNRVHSSPPFFS